MFQHLYDEWLTKLSEKAAHLSGLFPNIVVQEGAVEKPLRDYSVSEQAAILTLATCTTNSGTRYVVTAIQTSGDDTNAAD